MKRSLAAWMVVSGPVLAIGLTGCEPGGPIEASAKAPGFDLPARFTALGTEPFWSAKVDRTTLLYQTPEDQAGQRATLTRRELPGRIEFAGVLSGKPLRLTITPGPCSDGMSDTVYPRSAELRFGQTLLNGCVKLP